MIHPPEVLRQLVWIAHPAVTHWGRGWLALLALGWAADSSPHGRALLPTLQERLVNPAACVPDFPVCHPLNLSKWQDWSISALPSTLSEDRGARAPQVAGGDLVFPPQVWQHLCGLIQLLQTQTENPKA